MFFEKPIAVTLDEADELIALPSRHVKFTIGYSQRFNPKYAYVRHCIGDGTIGAGLRAGQPPHHTRPRQKDQRADRLSPAAMESTHDLDFLLWCLEPAKPVRVYSQVNYGARRKRAAMISPTPSGSR